MPAGLIDFNLLRPDASASFLKGMQEGEQHRNALVEQQRRNALADLQMRQAMQQQYEAQQEQRAYSGAESLEDVQKRLRQAGLGKQAYLVGEKAAMEREKREQFDVQQAEKRLKMFQDVGAQIAADPANAKTYLQQLQKIAGVDISAPLAQIEQFGGNLDGIRQWGRGQAMTAAKMVDQMKTMVVPAGAAVMRDGQVIHTQPPVRDPNQMTEYQRQQLVLQQRRVELAEQQAAGRAAGGTAGTAGNGKTPTQTAKETAVEQGRESVGAILGGIKNEYKALDQLGAIPSTKRGVVSNLSAMAGAAAPQVGTATGSQAEVHRKAIRDARLILLNSIAQATGMSTARLNSNVELQTWLNALTDPGQQIESVEKTIKNIEEFVARNSKAGGNQPEARWTGGDMTPQQLELVRQGAASGNPEAQAVLSAYQRRGQAGQQQMNPQDQQALEWARSNPNDPRSKKILQRLGVSQ